MFIAQQVRHGRRGARILQTFVSDLPTMDEVRQAVIEELPRHGAFGLRPSDEVIVYSASSTVLPVVLLPVPEEG